MHFEIICIRVRRSENSPLLHETHDCHSNCMSIFHWVSNLLTGSSRYICNLKMHNHINKGSPFLKYGHFQCYIPLRKAELGLVLLIRRALLFHQVKFMCRWQKDEVPTCRGVCSPKVNLILKLTETVEESLYHREKLSTANSFIK